MCGTALRVDFYQLGQSSLEEVLPRLAVSMMKAAARVLVVSAQDQQLARISNALWDARGQFLAHAPAGSAHDERQPILLSDSLETANGANFLVLADGLWREGAERFERVFLLFGTETIDDARALWRRLGEQEGAERNYWRQESGGWVRAA